MTSSREPLIPAGVRGMLPPMTAACTGEEILALIREEGMVDLPGHFAVGEDLFDAGLDSMAVMQLIVVIEERYGVALGAADASRESLGTAERIAATIRSRA